LIDAKIVNSVVDPRRPNTSREKRMTDAPSASTQRWQYKTLRFATGQEFEEVADQMLNELGAEGWEVTGFTRFEIGRENGYRVILKRRL
jgi:hypothetical protein